MPPLAAEISPHPSTPIRSWLPNESLFSLCSRNHIFWGNTLPAQTCERLFGHAQQGTQHDLPSNVRVLADRTGGSLGSAAEIIRQHTILRFFAPFQSYDGALAAEQAMLGPHLGSLKFRLGLITGRFGAQHPLRACPECMEEDIARFGMTYWHLDHQYPGVLICSTHLELLRESIYKRMWRGRFSWCLPALHELVRCEDPGLSSRSRLQHITDACLRLAGIGFNTWIDITRLKHAYAAAIAGISHWPGRHCSLPSSAIESFTKFTKPLQAIHPFDALPANDQQAEAYLRYLLLPPRSPGHPLRHLAAITWMFESFDQFLEAKQGPRTFR
ncbi:TniQ family protein [Pseudomonas tohonis]|uniref:TniQ family protein n=1 Tax=Pseudomonas tohonis TaxID=2725477 RepID=UPI0015648D40